MARTTATEEAVDYSAYVNKAATPFQARYHDWVLESCDLDPNGLKSKAAAFAMGMRLAIALYATYQKSPENQEARAEEKAEREAAAIEKAKAPKPARGRKAAATAAAAEDTDEVDGDDADDAVAPTPIRGRKAKAAAPAADDDETPARTPAKRAGRRTAEAPF